MFKEKFESEFDYVFSVDTDGLIQVNNKKENDEKLVLGKKTSSLSYADKAGQYYLFPAENNLFINEIKEKKIGLNKISGVKNKHLVPLKKYGLAARLLTHIDSYGEALFVAKQIGLNDIVPTIVSLFKETPILGLTPIIEFTDDWLLLNHSSLFEIFNYKLNDTTSYHKLNNATAYYDTLSNRQRGVLFQIISNKLLTQIRSCLIRKVIQKYYNGGRNINLKILLKNSNLYLMKNHFQPRQGLIPINFL